MSAWIACCSLREGVLLFSGFQALTGLYWIGSSLDESHPWPSTSGMAQVIISLLLLNSLSGFLAVHRRSITCAVVNIACHGVLLGLLTAAFVTDHPSSCSLAAKGADTELGGLSP